MTRALLYVSVAVIAVLAILILATVGPGGFVVILPFLPFILVIWWAGTVLFALRDIAYELRALRKDLRHLLPAEADREVKP